MRGIGTWVWMVVWLAAAGSLPAAEISIGMSTALSGPAQGLGQGVKHGIELYFDKINASGGVHGNTLKLIAYDDGYEPARAAPAMRKLVLEDKVLAVIGNVGTPTAVVSVPIANEQNLLLFGAFTGAGLLRKTPPDRYVINYRASYAEETEELVAGLLKAGIKPSEIAFFSQNDSYGDAGYQGALLALKKQGYEDGEKLAHGRYTRNTLNVEDAVVTVVEAAPRAVIMVGAYRPCAKFIQMVKTFLPNTLFANVSFVGSAQLALELGQAGEGVIVTQVVPPPQSGLPAVAEFQAELAKVKGEEAVGFDFSMLEGYLVAKLFVAGLQQAGSQPSRESLIDALEKLQNLDIGIGVPVSYSKTNHQASHQVWPTILRDGVYTPLQWESLRQAPPVPASVPKPKQNP